MAIPKRTIERLIVYRRALAGKAALRVENVFSHELAAMARVTSVQVRRDLMEAGLSGSPSKGYSVERLIDQIGLILDAPNGLNAAVIGVGNMGRALLAYFSGRNSKINIVAAFDNDPTKIDRVIAGCRCYDSVELRAKVKELGIAIGIITVPVDRAQPTVDALSDAGVTGILNFAPVPLRVRPEVHVEQVDIMRALEKVAHFAKQEQSKEV